MATSPAHDPTAQFDAERARLASIAYRMLGTPDDADDIVQDVWLRWHAADRATIDDPAAWLTTVTTRLSIDRLRSARARREVYVGPWLPEPVVTADDDPYQVAASVDSLTIGFLSVLERLQPLERAVFLLHDVFGYPFDQIAASVDRTPAATRQIAKRARDRVHAERPRHRADPDEAEALANAFLGALMTGDIEQLTAMLSPDVVHLSDGGAERRAARRPVVGPERVARLLTNLAKRAEPGTQIHPVHVGGQLGWYALVDDQPFILVVPTFHDGLVTAIHAVLNPEKLARFHRRWLASAP